MVPSDQLTLIAGIRVSEDEKDVKASQVNSSTATGGIGINNPIKIIVLMKPFEFKFFFIA